MISHRSALRGSGNYFLLISIFLLTAGSTVAQTSISSASKSDEPEAAKTTPVPAPVNAKTGIPAQPVVPANPPPVVQCGRTINADVVALPKAVMLNRMGATVPDGFIFALKGDTEGTGNQVQLRADRRARPLVLRANIGDCLKITLTNAIPVSSFAKAQTPAVPVGTTEVSLHIQGMEWMTGSQDDGSFVGKNSSSLATALPPPPTPSPMPTPNTQTYNLYAKDEGTFLMYTMGDTSSEGNQLSRGLFGALNVQPAGAEWYRSQVTADDLVLATYNANNPDQVPPGSLVCTPPGGSNCVFTVNGKSVKVIKTPDFGTGPGMTKGGYLHTLDNHPLIDYNAVYPKARLDGTLIPAALVGVPILKMLDANNNIVHGDLTAIITGPNAGRFPGLNGNPNKPDPPCNAENNPALGSGPVNPLFCTNPASPDRKQPYREVTIMYHEVGQIASQAFPIFNDPSMSDTLNAGFDGFAINYGTGGIAAEIFANRIGVGPMGSCVDCKFEEFFLSAWPVGDPAMLVNKPANAPCTLNDIKNGQNCVNPTGTRTPATGFPYTMQPVMKATAAFFPDDPSNVYHSYINDHIKFRILHGGTVATHVHHQHAHQWLQSPNSDEGAYLDSQMISPGASYTLEMVYNGSGNRNKVVGDSIFHCHFYPHFAAGMWAMWRTHDVFESGTFVYPGLAVDPISKKLVAANTAVNGQDVSNQVVPGSRALPDGEITTGSPMPALVPLPTLPMAPLPGYAQIQNNVQVNGVTVPNGGQVVIGGKCQANKVNGLDVVKLDVNNIPVPATCVDGTVVNGKVIDSQYDFAKIKMVGQFLLTDTLENPGFPYFIPGIAGARAPHPPLDFACTAKDAQGKCLPGTYLDGGLPRHIVTGGSIKFEAHDQLDWSKDLKTMNAVQLQEDGTDIEKTAMNYFSKRCYPTFLTDGTPGSCVPLPKSTAPQMTLLTPPTGFILNGLPLGPQQGAPFADPAVDDNGNPINYNPATKKQTTRRYQAAAIQLNVTLNKKGWHFPQQRILTLWKDVAPTIAYTPQGSGGKPPEPLFFRGNSGDIIEYWHTNLVPNYYLVDDFQVRTPTDILGQHIHLVKFDVTSSDGAGNGFNYEDGTFSPEEVQEIHDALTAPGGSWTGCTGCSSLRDPQPPPADICAVPQPPAQCASEWKGAQTTIQRWYLDPLVDDSGVDRTLRTVFTHDHFGPSTHQQAGLYAGLVVEPMKSTWTSNDGTQNFGSRSDGGPTSWQARIISGPNNADSYREFLLEFQDLQLAYENGSRATASANPREGWRDPTKAINPAVFPGQGVMPRLISTGNLPATGTQSVNYYNEPIAWRVGQFDDLSYAYDNQTALKNGDVGDPQNPNPDPWTPLMRAYENDNVQVRVLVGAHVFAHQFNLEGPTWFAEPSWKNSGFRSAQPMGLSEHFELLFRVPSSSAPSINRKCPDGKSDVNCVDYLYSPSLDQTGIPNGLWGLFRSYAPNAKLNDPIRKTILPLPNNSITPATNVTYNPCPGPPNRPADRVFNITAVTSQKALSTQPQAPGQLVFNNRGNPNDFISTSMGVMYVRSEDLDGSGVLKPGVPIEPLILRANAGDCIEVNLTNAIAANSAVLSHTFSWPSPFNVTNPQGNPIWKSNMSHYVGLHPQLLSYDAVTSFGTNVGWNSKAQPDQFANIGETIKYRWYAGTIKRSSAGSLTYTPVELGSLNLFPSDPIFQNINGLFGSMIIEPPQSTWGCGEAGNLRPCDPPPATSTIVQPPPTSRASATVTLSSGAKFREFAVMISDNLVTSSTASAINYGSEPKTFRYPNSTPTDFSCMTSNLLTMPGTLTQPGSPAVGDPKTPVFTAAPGDQVRFRMTHPFGTGDSQVFTVHGHVWQRNPYTQESQVIGNNNLSQWLGSRDNHGSTDHFDLVIDSAGGSFKRPGDYLYTAFLPDQASVGAWGIFRVGDPGTPSPNARCTQPATGQPAPAKAPVKPLERFRRLPTNSATPKP